MSEPSESNPPSPSQPSSVPPPIPSTVGNEGAAPPAKKLSFAAKFMIVVFVLCGIVVVALALLFASCVRGL